MLSNERGSEAVLIGTLFAPRTEVELGVRNVLRATALLSTHEEYLRNSQIGSALRQTRMGLIAFRELLERGVDVEASE